MSDNSETQWEYEIVAALTLDRPTAWTHTPVPTKELTDMGNNGWELVGFHRENAYFKRRKASGYV